MSDLPISGLRIKAKLKPIAIPEPEPSDSDGSDDGDDDLLAFPLYDLRKGSGVGDPDGPNSAIVEMLDQLIAFTTNLKATSSGKDKADQQRRILSFIKGRDAIKDYPKPIKSGSQAQRDIDGVGKGIATRIQEFLTTGGLAEMKVEVSPEARTILDLTEITGIGEVKAVALMKDYGITSVDDLIARYRRGEIRAGKGITHHIAVGLQYYYDLKTRMPWSEADQIATAIRGTLRDIDPRLVVEVCGSYRRMRPTCGDLDVLISHPDIYIPDDSQEATPLPGIVTKLEQAGILSDHLTTGGHTKYMGICKGPTGVGRRIDIRYISYDSMGAAMLYFTGSGKFNKIMRYHANARGYTLNEYGLYHYVNTVRGDKVVAPTERDIFRILRFVYLTPTERDF